MAAAPTRGRSAVDGSPHPDRSAATFERDVQRMFSHIVEGYEWFDHVASLGNDYLWRFRALGDLRRRFGHPVGRALDIGCGTGELVRAVGRRYPAAELVAIDFTLAMVRRAKEVGLGPRGARSGFARATALRLPFPAGWFDLVTNAFVLRNLRDLGAALREMRRVLRPGGVLLSLDITEPTSPGVSRAFHAYFDHVVPLLGRAAASEGPYRYLPESVQSLPPRAALLNLLREAGFHRVAAFPQSLGIVTTFFGEVASGAAQSA